MFQEDDIVDLTLINTALLRESAHFPADHAMIDFLETTELTEVPFSTLYSFYATPVKFNEFLDQVVNKLAPCNNNDCYIGCGNAIGCCGNYAGCCVYSSVLCMWHDIECSSCNSTKVPCGPQCQPTTPDTPTVHIFTGL